MRKSIINYQGIAKQIVAIQENTQNAIIAAMQAQNVRLISFALNGDNLSYDVPKAYALEYNDDESDYTFREVVCIFHDNINLYIVTDNEDLTMEELNELEDKTIIPMYQCDTNANINFEKAINISDTYNPTELTLELAESVEAVLLNVLRGRKIKNIVYFDNII